MGLRDVAAPTPAPVGIEDWGRAQDGQMKGIDPVLRTGKQEGQRQNETERVSKRERKRRERSQNLAKKQDMDQSRGKSKAFSLWKHRRETEIVCLNIRPHLLHE